MGSPDGLALFWGPPCPAKTLEGARLFSGAHGWWLTWDRKALAPLDVSQAGAGHQGCSAVLPQEAPAPGASWGDDHPPAQYKKPEYIGAME